MRDPNAFAVSIVAFVVMFAITLFLEGCGVALLALGCAFMGASIRGFAEPANKQKDPAPER